ncbi:hypothetical protein [Mesorhizobium sp.]|uniref:hypothetical protein n=1 Tax=Mesorhizobium sp. TaxID=1871066 RepID=UPI002587D2F7|nr:hypothetical protein [Mesorhizobium sp.]
MRAKMQITHIEKFEGSPNERLHFTAVSKISGYPADGSDEDNSYAKFSPQGNLTLTIANPALHGKFAEGEKYYLDFTKTD